jgi:riboflavin synthase
MSRNARHDVDRTEIKKPVAILDRQLSLPADAKIFSTASHCHVYYDKDLPIETVKTRNNNCTYHGISVTNNRLDLSAIIAHLGELGFHDVWVEAGGHLFSALHKDALVQTTYLYLAPMANEVKEEGRRLLVKVNTENKENTAIQNLSIGESIAINGVCLTLLPDFEEGLAFDISPETLQLTTLGQLVPGERVNLERSMLANTRFGGHYVTGHVETTATLRSIVSIGDCKEIWVDGFQASAQPFLLPKGSICLDGVSLTINTVEASAIQLMLVPHTLAHTNLGSKKVGQHLNVEFDYFTRIVAHQIGFLGQFKHEVLL